MNDSDAWRKDDLGRGKQKYCYFRLRLKVPMVGDEPISIIEFQMTGAAERKEREPKLVLDGVRTKKCWSKERRERTGW